MGQPRAVALAAILVLPSVFSGSLPVSLSAPSKVGKPLEQGGRVKAGEAWNRLGVLYTNQARPREALDAFDEALKIWKALGDHDQEARTLHNQGTTYTGLGRLSESLEPLQRSLDIRSRAGNLQGQASTLTAIAWVHTLQGESAKALGLFDQAIKLREAAKDEAGMAATLDRRGTALTEMGRMADAAASYQKSLKISRSLGKTVWAAHTRSNLGQLYVKAGDPRKGEQYLLEALPVLHGAGDRNAEAHTLLWLAHAARRKGDLPLALKRVEESVALVRAVRSEAPGSGLRASYTAQRYGYQELWIDILMELHAQKPNAGFDLRALEASEESRSRGLLEVRNEEGAAVRPHEKLPRLDAEIRKLESSLRLPLPLESVEVVENKLETLVLQRNRLRSIPPAGEASREMSRLHELRKLLGADTVLLEYAVGEERSFLWVVDAKSVETHVLPGRAALERQVRDALDVLSSGHRRKIERSVRVAAQLGETLLGPVALDLGGKRVLIVPDGVLHKVPFAVLPARPGGPPLLSDHEIATAPSASAVSFLRRELALRTPARGLLALLADPVYGLEDGRLGRARVPLRPNQRPRFERLTATRSEAKSILGLLPEDAKKVVAVDFAANRGAVLDGLLADSRILHFATHAEIDEEHPDLSSLVLSLVDAEGQPREGHLRAYEIRDLDLSADLVVLSACSTGVGRELRGEGPLALSRAFLEAGAARVVVSLWDVEDEATAELMRRFYRHYFDGVPPAQALRQAQLAMSREPRWAAPYYWAGFVLQGEWR